MASKVQNKELLERLTGVFQTYGYDGATLSRISEATGLKRASLYHRFPGGKKEMAEAVLARADEWFVNHILAPLSGPGTRAEGIRAMAERLHTFYAGGSVSCLLNSIAVGYGDSDLDKHVEQSMTAWVEVLAGVAQEAGLPAHEARHRAEDAVLRIQGALVLARAMGDRKPFERTLKGLPNLILDQEDEDAS